MKIAKTVIAACLAASTLMTGCANTDSHTGAMYGEIEGIEITRGSTGAVTIVGCGVPGENVGALPGPAGGAMTGNETEKGSGMKDISRIRVRLDSGAYLTMTQPGITGLRVGNRVRIENDRISRY